MSTRGAGVMRSAEALHGRKYAEGRAILMELRAWYRESTQGPSADALLFEDDRTLGERIEAYCATVEEEWVLVRCHYGTPQRATVEADEEASS